MRRQTFSRRLLLFAATATLIAVGTVAPVVPAPAASAQDSKADIETELLDVKSSLDAAQARREETVADLDKLEAELSDTVVGIEEAKVSVAAAESAVALSEDRISDLARAMYLRPTSELMAVFSADSITEYVVGQAYVRRAINKDADALDAYRDARESSDEQRNALTTRERELKEQRALKQKWQAIVEQSIQKEESLVVQLQQRLQQAQTLGAVPWTTLATCPTGAVKSNLGGPYILEDWAVFTLRSLAMRTNKPVQDVVTQQHIIALVAFAWGEGGGIQGHRGQFNPLNTNGWWRLFPELGGVPSGRGTDDWPTFDNGVEATARALTSKTQNRTGRTLLIPSSTATDFFQALASPELYPGNKNWSANDKLHIGKYASLTARVSSSYAKYAGEPMRAAGQVVIGLPRLPTGIGPPGALDQNFTC